MGIAISFGVGIIGAAVMIVLILALMLALDDAWVRRQNRRNREKRA